jgi:hypothetical protein
MQRFLIALLCGLFGLILQLSDWQWFTAVYCKLQVFLDVSNKKSELVTGSVLC